MQRLQRNSYFPEQTGGSFHEEKTVSSVSTIDELINEVQQERQTATDTDFAPAPEAIDENDATAEKTESAEQAQTPFTFAPPPQVPEVADPAPMFPGLTSEETNDDNPGPKKDEPGKYSLPAKKAERKFNIMFKVRDTLQSRLLALYANDDDRDQFRMDEEDEQILRDYYLQVIEDNGGKIPWWVDLVLVEGSVMLPKIQLAKKLRKVNAENARLRAEISQLRGNTPVLNEVPKRERRNWKIDKNGYFEKDEYGNYIPKADRTDKASLNDIEKIAEYNSRKIVQEAFNLSEEEISKLYPDE